MSWSNKLRMGGSGGVEESQSTVSLGSLSSEVEENMHLPKFCKNGDRSECEHHLPHLGVVTTFIIPNYET